MASTVKPQVIIHQNISVQANATANYQLAHISGGNAQLHRYSKSDEKSGIYLGKYDRNNDKVYSWPSRSAGGLVDPDYTKLFADNALLMYLEDLINDNVPGHGTVTPVSGYSNRVRSDTINFADNGPSSPEAPFSRIATSR